MVFFSIGCNTAPFNSLTECLQRQWWEILPCGGVQRTAPCLLLQMDSGFYGIGLPHPGMECFVAQMEKLLIHYGSKSGIGIYMQMSMSMEMFVTSWGYPFNHSRLHSSNTATTSCTAGYGLCGRRCSYSNLGGNSPATNAIPPRAQQMAYGGFQVLRLLPRQTHPSKSVSNSSAGAVFVRHLRRQRQVN